jgi:crotonobetainyl-CoA:carnitine CoA-transferase CaiB-like acyl-CoA transferase
VPLLEAALNIAAEQVIEHSANGRLLTRDGNRGPAAAPQGVYRCGDGSYVAIAVADDAQWRGLRGLLDEPEWARDPALDSAAGRRAAHDDIDGHLGTWLSDQDPSQAVERLLAAGVPAERVVNAHYVMPHPQLEHRGFFKTLEHPETGSTRYPSWPMGPAALPVDPLRSPPPTLGQHNEEILAGELGLTEAELADLREKKIIGTRPSFM